MKARQLSYSLVWRMVSRIPHGKVCTYGEIARRCRLSGQARFVGYALHGLPDGIDVPWHRVINSSGKISFSSGSASYARQKKLLVSEGVVFVRDRVDLRIYGWKISRPKGH